MDFKNINIVRKYINATKRIPQGNFKLDKGETSEIRKKSVIPSNLVDLVKRPFWFSHKNIVKNLTK